MKKYVFQVNAKVEIKAQNYEEARQKFWDEVEGQPQRMACYWIDDNLTITEEDNVR